MFCENCQLTCLSRKEDCRFALAGKYRTQNQLLRHFTFFTIFFYLFFFLRCICSSYKGINLKFLVLKTNCPFFYFSPSKRQKDYSPPSLILTNRKSFSLFFLLLIPEVTFADDFCHFLLSRLKELLQFKHMKTFPMFSFVMPFQNAFILLLLLFNASYIFLLNRLFFYPTWIFYGVISSLILHVDRYPPDSPFADTDIKTAQP